MIGWSALGAAAPVLTCLGLASQLSYGITLFMSLFDFLAPSELGTAAPFWPKPELPTEPSICLFFPVLSMIAFPCPIRFVIEDFYFDDRCTTKKALIK